MEVGRRGKRGDAGALTRPLVQSARSLTHRPVNRVASRRVRAHSHSSSRRRIRHRDVRQAALRRGAVCQPGGGGQAVLQLPPTTQRAAEQCGSDGRGDDSGSHSATATSAPAAACCCCCCWRRRSCSCSERRPALRARAAAASAPASARIRARGEQRHSSGSAAQPRRAAPASSSASSCLSTLTRLRPRRIRRFPLLHLARCVWRLDALARARQSRDQRRQWQRQRRRQQ